jgi:hypothetical protein
MSAGCELLSGLVSIKLPARLPSDDCLELKDEVVTHDGHVENVGRLGQVRGWIVHPSSFGDGLMLLEAKWSSRGPIGQPAGASFSAAGGPVVPQRDSDKPAAA